MPEKKKYEYNKKAQDAYMKKMKEIKIRIPEEYLLKIQQHAATKNLSVNKLIISLLENDMGIDILTIRDRNKLEKENKE